MDKFGIFNLLNSFFSLNGQNSSSQTDNSSPPIDKILTSLSNSLSNKQNTEKQKPPLPEHRPLQSSMLFTMTSHEQFVKRVKEKNKV